MRQFPHVLARQRRVGRDDPEGFSLLLAFEGLDPDPGDLELVFEALVLEAGGRPDLVGKVSLRVDAAVALDPLSPVS